MATSKDICNSSTDNVFVKIYYVREKMRDEKERSPEHYSSLT